MRGIPPRRRPHWASGGLFAALPKSCCSPTRWGRWRTRCSPCPPGRSACSPPGRARSVTPCRSTSIFPATAIWPSAWAACLGFTSWRTSTIRTLRPRSRSSGGGGISRCRPGSAITCISRWAATGRAADAPGSTVFLCFSPPDCGTAQAGILCSGGCGTACFRCWRTAERCR